MQWDDGRESENVEDVRGESGGGGGLGGLPFGGRSVGIGTIVVALAASYFFGIDPRVILGLGGGGGGDTPVQRPPQTRQTEQTQQAHQSREGPQGDREARFVSRVLLDTEETWSAIFAASGAQYRKPKLDLFTGAYPTACGQGQAAMGPFYCPGDEKIYLDLDFFRLLAQRFHAPGEFAEAYVIAHEVGHHVQKLTGVTAKTEQMRRQMSEREYNRVSVRVELQADCFAGVWGNRLATGQSPLKLDPGDVETALTAATAIGDDTLQKQARGAVVPDSFTHGSSAQRVRWFKRGMDSGDVRQCDTFGTSNL